MSKYSLDSVSIDGFRGLKNVVLDDLGLINVLVGENNSGKTSVVEAMSILCDPFNPHEWLRLVRRRDYGRLDETRVQSLRWCFRQRGELTDPSAMVESECVMKCAGLFPVRTLRVAYREIVGEPDTEFKKFRKELSKYLKLREPQYKFDVDQDRRGAEIVHDVESDLAQSNLFEPSSSPSGEPIAIRVWEDMPASRILEGISNVRQPSQLRRRIKSQTLTPFSYQINPIQVRSFSRQSFNFAGMDIGLDLVKEFDPDVQKIEVASFRGHRPAIYLLHKKLGPAPLSIFGDGLRRAVLLAGVIPDLRDGGVLLIDELETGIHAKALNRVFSWLIKVARELNIQIVATTHSLEAVNSIAIAATDHIEDMVTFHLDQTSQETRVKRIAGELLLRLRRERGLDVR